MKTYAIKDLYKGLSTNSLLFDSYLSSFYPDIEGNESNFLTDYGTSHAVFDKAFNQKYGNRLIDLEANTVSDAITEARGIFSAVTMLNLNNWARLYYALSLDYNPLYNVDGTTTFTHGATEETRDYGADKTTNKYAQKQNTNQYGATEDTIQYGATQDTMEYGNTSRTEGSHKDTDTEYSTAYNSGVEAETGKTDHDIASITTTETTHTDTASSIIHSDVSSSLQHTDTLTEAAHNDSIERDAHKDTIATLSYTDTEVRQGNIGVTKSTDLLDSEMQLRMKSSFWDVVFKALITEGGAYYDYQAL